MATKKWGPGFRFYQKEGGNETWELLRDDLAKWDEIRPTFMSILKVDKAYRTDSTAAQWAEARYAGPLYFDFDDADDPVNAVRGAISLLKLMDKDGVPPNCCDIYLSGGKGVHITVSTRFFTEGYEGALEPFELNLPLIYKELAFRYATPCMDFCVYSQRSGRMWRTHYNVRSNGLYKVPVTFEELQTIRSNDDYADLCKAPREVTRQPLPEATKGALSARLSTLYAETVEFITDKLKNKKGKKVERQLPTGRQLQIDEEGFAMVASGEGIKDDKGWNHIALQLCLYARNYAWTLDDLLEKTETLINNYPFESYRYNSPKKRRQELTRMFEYIIDNPTYEYSFGGLNHLLVQPPATTDADGKGDVFDPALQITSTSICAETEDGIRPIANFGLTNCRNLMSVDDTTQVYASAFDLSTRTSATAVDINPQDFTGSARLQNELSKVGGVFIGLDTQARGLYHIVSSFSQTKSYVVDKSGLSIIRFTVTNSPGTNRLYPVWMDDAMIVSSRAAEDVGIRFEHRPHMSEVHTDLSKAHQWDGLLKTAAGREKVAQFFLNLFRAKRPAIMGRLLGWYMACFYKQLFQHYVGSFPLLHIYGVAGAGKTETQRLLMRLFTVDEAPTELSPGTSLFAFVRLMSSSASIPVLLDEWKPAEYKEAQVGDYRGIMREAYNQKPWVRAGVAGRRDSFSGLTKYFLAAPLVYVGEAAESQTAIVERSVMVGFSRSSDQEQAASYRAFLDCTNDHDTLPALGRYIAGSILTMPSLDDFNKEFSKIRDEALEKNTLSVADFEAHQRGELTDEEYRHKSMTKIRTMLGACTVEFGLRKLQSILQASNLPAESMSKLLDYFEEAYQGLYLHDGSAELAVPEYVKTLTSMSDLAKTDDLDSAGNMLVPDKDYAVFDQGNKRILRLMLKSVWLKYVRHLKDLNLRPMFVEALAFQNALKATHHFVFAGKDPQTTLEYIDLDYTSLLRAGCGDFPDRKFKGGVTKP